MLGAVLNRVMRLFSVLLLTDVVLARHILVLIYVYVSVCVRICIDTHPRHLSCCAVDRGKQLSKKGCQVCIH